MVITIFRQFYENEGIEDTGLDHRFTDKGSDGDGPITARIKYGPDVINLFLYSTQLSMNSLLLINVKMPTIVGILTFMSGKIAF